MDLILCHATADFDTLGAAVGLTYLLPGSKIVVPGGLDPTVKEFLALHRDEYPLIERRSVNAKDIHTLSIVDTQKRDRLGKTQEWLDLPNIQSIKVYDHHLNQSSDIPATSFYIDGVGAVTTLIVEELQAQQVNISPSGATVMALGIHVDTGSLTFENTTSRDAIALGWLMSHGVSLSMVAEYVQPSLSPDLQSLLKVALDNLQKEEVRGYTIASVMFETEEFVNGLSTLASELVNLTEIDALLLSSVVQKNQGNRLSLIGRSQIPGTNLGSIFRNMGGGGHGKAASLSLRDVDATLILNQLLEKLRYQIPHPPTARDLMSSPVRTIIPETTIAQAQRILLRYGHSGLSVVNDLKKLVGIISRRDIDIALHHGFSHAPVKGYMSKNLKTINPDTTLPEIESLMVTYDIGRLPVLENEALVGIVTRTDVLRELHQEAEQLDIKDRLEITTELNTQDSEDIYSPNLTELRDRLAPILWEFLTKASSEAKNRGWHLYLVGGAVRDLLLADPNQPLLIQDIDLVVDGFHKSADVGAGVELARALQEVYTGARLEIHGSFQTAALLWHKHPQLGSLWVDIATARTEFYPYPAANPEVEASSIRQDLYRRDFTINALALRFTPPRAGKLMDFFGGLLDLHAKQIRVLHSNSFIEDPTRIYRAVRFAVRLGFMIESQTEEYIRYAINSGVYNRTAIENPKTPALQTRLKAELKYILQASYWKGALQLLDELDALQCIHPTLRLNEELLRQLHLMEHCLKRFDSQQQRFNHWQMRLEVIIAHLAPEYRNKVAKNLQLPDESIQRLEKLRTAQIQISQTLPKCEKTSQIVQLLQQYNLPILILIALQTPRNLRKQIWHYATVLVNIQPLLNGNDLKTLGYKPGPSYKQMLDNLLWATLDGEISTQEMAKEYLLKHYPK
ncbi:MAG: CBS domain-containing protein [Cyanobacteria bacterium P01_A01_bin.84]